MVRQLPTRGRPDRRATLLACLVRGLARAEPRLSGATISHGVRRGGEALVAGHEYRSLQAAARCWSVCAGPMSSEMTESAVVSRRSATKVCSWGAEVSGARDDEGPERWL